jgi:hypothetical protein
MKNMQVQSIFAVMLLILIPVTSQAQDYIITWNDDTLRCELPSNPADAGFRPRANHKNGYLRVAAIFPNDSVRVIDAGEIKGYYRAKHGKSLLCDGQFYSIETKETARTVTDADGKKNPHTWYFMVVDEPGKYASLCKILVYGKRLQTCYYIVKHEDGKGTEGAPASTRKQVAEYLAEKDIAEGLTAFIKENKSYSKMVKEYNRLKEAAEKKP